MCYDTVKNLVITMSKTYRNVPEKSFQYHPHSIWKQSAVDDHDGYRVRPRHRKGNLVSAWDDEWKGILDDPYSFDPDRKRKIKSRQR